MPRTNVTPAHLAETIENEGRETTIKMYKLARTLDLAGERTFAANVRTYADAMCQYEKLAVDRLKQKAE